MKGTTNRGRVQLTIIHKGCNYQSTRGVALPAVSYVQNVLVRTSLEQLADKSVLVAAVMIMVENKW